MGKEVALGLMTWAVPFLILSLAGFISWSVKQRINKVDKLETTVTNHEGKIENLENTSVTAEQVRIIIHQSNEPLKQSMQSLESTISQQTTTINTVLQQLAERRGYEEAIKELRRIENDR